MTSLLDHSALHLELPTECVSANVIVDLEHVQYPGIFGTGFFAKQGQQVFYFTALHCLRKNPVSESPEFSTLAVPYRHTGVTTSPDDFIQVETAFTIGEPGSVEQTDLVGCPVLPAKRDKDWEHLLSRAARLPASGKWLDEYLASQQGQAAMATGSYAGYVIGHPKDSHGNEIRYGESEAVAILSTEAVSIEGKVSFSNLSGHLELHLGPLPFSLSGFSGSPVFAPVATPRGRQFTLLGIGVCGSSQSLNFLPIGRLLEAIDSNA